MHKHNSDQVKGVSIEDLETTQYKPDFKGHIGVHEESGLPRKENLFKNWPLMSSIIVYCIFSLHDMAYSEVLYFV